MASDDFVRLSRLLLQQSDRHPIRTLSGCELATFDDQAVREFERLGLIARLKTMRERDVRSSPQKRDALFATEIEELELQVSIRDDPAEPRDRFSGCRHG